MNERERALAYAECSKRGHSPSGRVLTSNPPWDVCEFCGTHFRYESRGERMMSQLPNCYFQTPIGEDLVEHLRFEAEVTRRYARRWFYPDGTSVSRRDIALNLRAETKELVRDA